MTNHWIDLKNADAFLIMGSNAAEHHPISFKWVLHAKERGAVVIHVDPKFSRTSARSNFHVPLRSGTDIAFLGGMIKYILDNEKYFRDYVVAYTNASFLVNKDFGFKDGLFTGFDAKARRYDTKTWSFQLDADGVPKRDESLQDPNCVLQLMKKHYARYTLDKVSDITGVSRENLLKVYASYSATGTGTKAGTVMYALGWTQHSVGVQNIRSACMIQLLLGNIGIAGGGVNALRGEPNVQGSTDHALLYHIVPGYMATPMADWQTLADYHKANTPASKDAKSANWWQNKPKYMVSLLKGWFGDKATADNDFCYGLLPRLEAGVDYSYMYLFDRMYHDQIRGGFIFGLNPMNTLANTHKARAAMDHLDWVVTSELHHTETTDNWRRPGVDPKTIKTEYFLLPSAHRIEKEGTISNSGRWTLWHHKAIEPAGEAKNFGFMLIGLANKLRDRYLMEGGALPEAVTWQDWPKTYDAEEWTKRINGFFLADTKVGDKQYKKGQLVPTFGVLKDDGTTSSLCWIYTGSFTEEEGNKTKRRDPKQTPMQAKIGLYPNWSWCWPVNRRIIYNRASVDPTGRPWNPEKPLIAWENGKWAGDVPDGPWPPLANEGGKYPFIMQTHGFGALFGPGRVDGPFPEHYEPVETPVTSHPFSSQLSNPLYKFVSGDLDKLAKPGDPAYPVVLTTYSLTEHWCGGGETRNVPCLLEAEPQLYVEMSEELAKERGIQNGDGVIVESIRGRVEAIAMVTVRIRPFTVQGRTVHLVGMPFCFGWTTPECGDSTNRLTPSVADPNTTIYELKACLVDVKKADRLTEIAR
jgi:formate dehydrogenase major subunit